MRPAISLRLISFPFILGVVLLQNPIAMASESVDIARKQVYPALVNIQVVAQSYGGGRAQRASGGGSGVIVTATGYALTNFHVVGHTTHVTCTLLSGKVLNAHVVLDDPATDLSVVKIDMPAGLKLLPFAHLGDSDQLQAGDPVLAMGNPLMLSSSMTLGIVSNPRRVFTDFSGTALESRQLDAGEETGIFTRWIQHDALILPGNSGGPLVNLSGEVVGINELGGNGVGFAIPSNIGKTVLAAALAHKEIVRGSLDVSVLPVGKLGMDHGALVASVHPGGAGARGGLKPGDILESIDEKPITVQYFEQVPALYQLVADKPPGHVAAFSVLRGGKSMKVSVTIARLLPNVGPEYEDKALGATLRAITPAAAAQLGLDDTKGVMVTGTRPGKLLDQAKPPIGGGDVITAIDGVLVQGLDDMRRRAPGIAASLDKGKSVLVAIRRGQETDLSVIKKAAEHNPDNGFEIAQAWLGIRTQVLTGDLAGALGMPGKTGQRVTQVFQETAAEKAGLLPGDIITQIDDQQLQSSRPQDSGDLIEIVRRLRVGQVVDLAVTRGSHDVHVKVDMEADPSAAAPPPSTPSPDLEFSVRDINRLDRIQMQWDRTISGVLVTDVTGGGWAQVAGLHVGDLVLSIDGTATPDVPAFKAALAGPVKRHAREITLSVRRGTYTHFVFVEPDWSGSL